MYNDYMNKSLKILNVIRWTIVICCPIAFFVVAIVCRYRQIHYNANTAELFTTGFLIIILCLGCGMCLGFPKDYIELSEEMKNAESKDKFFWCRRKLCKVLMSNVGAIVLIILATLMLVLHS